MNQETVLNANRKIVYRAYLKRTCSLSKALQISNR